MKRIAVLLVMMGITASVMAESTLPEGVEASVSLDAASAYVFRGSTFNDGLVLQPGAEGSYADFTVGTWANFDIDDYDDALEGGKFSEVDLYGSYGIPVEAVDLSVGYTAYIYPLDSTDTDHELSVSLELDTILAPSVGVFYGVGGGIEETLYIEASISHEVKIKDGVTAECGLAIGYLDPEEGDSGFSHANLSAGLSYRIFSASVTYVAQIDDDVLADVDDEGAYDIEVLAMVGVSVDL